MHFIQYCSCFWCIRDFYYKLLLRGQEFVKVESAPAPLNEALLSILEKGEKLAKIIEKLVVKESINL